MKANLRSFSKICFSKQLHKPFLKLFKWICIKFLFCKKLLKAFLRCFPKLPYFQVVLIFRWSVCQKKKNTQKSSEILQKKIKISPWLFWLVFAITQRSQFANNRFFPLHKSFFVQSSHANFTHVYYNTFDFAGTSFGLDIKNLALGDDVFHALEK